MAIPTPALSAMRVFEPWEFVRAEREAGRCRYAGRQSHEPPLRQTRDCVPSRVGSGLPPEVRTRSGAPVSRRASSEASASALPCQAFSSPLAPADPECLPGGAASASPPWSAIANRPSPGRWFAARPSRISPASRQLRRAARGKPASSNAAAACAWRPNPSETIAACRGSGDSMRANIWLAVLKSVASVSTSSVTLRRRRASSPASPMNPATSGMPSTSPVKRCAETASPAVFRIARRNCCCTAGRAASSQAPSSSSPASSRSRGYPVRSALHRASSLTTLNCFGLPHAWVTASAVCDIVPRIAPSRPSSANRRAPMPSTVRQSSS